MKIFLHSERAEQSPHYPVTVAPGGDVSFVPKEQAATHGWRNADGTAKQYEIVFKYGAAEVDDALGKYMVERGIAKRSRLLRRIAQLFDRHGRPIEEIFDKDGRPIILGDNIAA